MVFVIMYLMIDRLDFLITLLVCKIEEIPPKDESERTRAVFVLKSNKEQSYISFVPLVISVMPDKITLVLA